MMMAPRNSASPTLNDSVPPILATFQFGAAPRGECEALNDTILQGPVQAV